VFGVTEQVQDEMFKVTEEARVACRGELRGGETCLTSLAAKGDASMDKEPKAAS